MTTSPYYDAPENLDHIITLNDPNAYYDFQDVIVVKDTNDNKIYAASDSGCSCPSPFESHSFPTDFTEIRSSEDLESFIKTNGASGLTQEDIDSAVTAYKSAL